VDYTSHMAHFGHDDYTLNVPYGIFHLLKVNHVNKLIEEQKHTKEGDRQSSLFDLIVKLNLP
jgi:hypothetical protein